MQQVVRGNLAGVGALLMWSTIIGLIRSVTEAFGVEAGTALIYTVSAAVTLIKHPMEKLSQIPKAYLFGAGALFVAYEIVFSRAIGLAGDARQTLEVGMLNYLWPCLIVVFSMPINKTKLRWWVWPGTALSVIGLYWCVAANGNLDFPGFVENILKTPVPYILGLTAAILWALYCNLSVRYAKGHNAVPVFFSVIAVILWGEFLFHDGSLSFPGYVPVVELLIIGSVMGFSYSMWEKGIQQGNLIFLSVCSFFTPAASILFIALWLDAMPPPAFWFGVAMVIGGALLCWRASKPKATDEEVA